MIGLGQRSIGAHAGQRLLTGALAFRVAGGERGASAGPLAVDLWLESEQRTLRLLAEGLYSCVVSYLLGLLVSEVDSVSNLSPVTF